MGCHKWSDCPSLKPDCQGFNIIVTISRHPFKRLGVQKEETTWVSWLEWHGILNSRIVYFFLMLLFCVFRSRIQSSTTLVKTAFRLGATMFAVFADSWIIASRALRWSGGSRIPISIFFVAMSGIVLPRDKSIT